MKKLIVSFLLVSIVQVSFFSCQKDEVDFSKPLSVEQINKHISDVLSETGDFDWGDATNHFVWSAIVQGEGTATIGYSEYLFLEEEMNEDHVQEILDEKNTIIARIIDIEQTENQNLAYEDIILYEDSYFTRFLAKIRLLETVKQVRDMHEVRYLEPSYDKFEF